MIVHSHIPAVSAKNSLLIYLAEEAVGTAGVRETDCVRISEKSAGKEHGFDEKRYGNCRKSAFGGRK